MGKKTPLYLYLFFIGLVFLACQEDPVKDPYPLNPPYVSSFSPAEGRVGMDTIIISGGNYIVSAEETTVKFKGALAKIESISEDAIKVVVPEGAQTGPISLSSENSIAFSTKEFVVYETPEPKIKKFEPPFGGAGTEVTLYGQNLGTSIEKTMVQFNEVEAQILEIRKDTILKVLVPDGDVYGPITVTVEDAIGNSTYNFGKEITFESFGPNESFAGQTVTLYGSDFLYAIPLSVNFNDIPATILSITNVQIEVKVPPGVTDGPITLSAPGQSLESDTDFTVTPAPTLDSFDPLAGAVGTKVTLTGTEFDQGAVAVTFNGVDAEVTSSSDTQIETTVPMGASSGPIEVNIGGQTVQSAEHFTVIPPPAIETIEPMEGTPGTEVIITGSGFSHGTLSVDFSGTAAVISASSDTSITVTVPDGCETGPITVEVDAQSTQSASDFEVLVP